MIRRGGLQWGIHLVKLGQGARNVWVKNSRALFLGREGGAVTADVVFVVLSVCRLVLLSASLFTVQFLNRWRPVSWWSWEEVEEGSCWAGEAERAASRQNSHLEIAIFSNKDNLVLLWGLKLLSLPNWLTGLFMQGLMPGSAYTTFQSFKMVTMSD